MSAMTRRPGWKARAQWPRNNEHFKEKLKAAVAQRLQEKMKWRSRQRTVSQRLRHTHWTDMRLKRKSQPCFKTEGCAGEFAAKVGALGAAITRAHASGRQDAGQKPPRLQDWVYHCGGKEFGIHWQ